MVRRFVWPGGVAVNISACHAEDRGFESHPGRHFPLFPYRSSNRISYGESSSASNVRPCLDAYTPASERLVAPILLSLLPTWVSTVRMAIMSSSAISRSVLPLLTRRRTTSTSRWERPPVYPGGRRLSDSRCQVIHPLAQEWHHQVCRDLEGFFEQLLSPEAAPLPLRSNRTAA